MQIYVGLFGIVYEFLLPLFNDFPFCYGAVVCPMAGWDVFYPQKNFSYVTFDYSCFRKEYVPIGSR